jgi:hypothetical protein
MTQKAQIEAPTKQADHYHNAAKDIALELLQHPFAADVEKKKFTAQMHLIRAESFRTSIKLITGQIAPVSGGK